VIAYVDSSVLARAYLEDEDGSAEARRLLADRRLAKVTGALEVIQADALMGLAAGLRHGSGRIEVIAAPDQEVEEKALAIARGAGRAERRAA
jgi:predicted nucleic acid-binding protein